MSPPLNEAQKRYLRKVSGTKKPWSVDAQTSNEVKRERDFTAPYAIKFGKRFRRGTSGSRLSPAIRAMVNARLEKRKEFFASLGVSV